MTILDWTSAQPGLVADLYAAEAAYWRRTYRWDTVNQWAEVETARTTWGLPGLLARDGQGRVRGWLYYLRGEAGAQLGGLTATDEAATTALVEGMTAREGSGPLTAFIADRAPGVAGALARTGWVVTPHAYLMRATTDPTDAPDATATCLRPWGAADAETAATVLRNAYGADEGSLFAPDGSAAEWRRYVGGLLEATGCGRFLPQASAVARGEGESDEPEGVVLTTAIAPGTAHIAQIGVSRHAQQRGAGRLLLRYAMRQAEAGGYSLMTLVVSTTNARARRFYRAAGFVDAGTFLQARRQASPHL